MRKSKISLVAVLLSVAMLIASGVLLVVNFGDCVALVKQSFKNR